MNIKWDARAYSEQFGFVRSYGEGVLSLINKEEIIAQAKKTA